MYGWRGGLVEPVAVGVGLGLEHHLVELADTERAPLAAGEHLGLEQEAASGCRRRPGCEPCEVDVEQRQPLGDPRAGARPASTTSVSQKMLAVSASAIGSRRCSGVRPASGCCGRRGRARGRWSAPSRPSPLQLSSTSERSPMNDMQNAPPRLAVARRGVDPPLVERPVDEAGRARRCTWRTPSRTDVDALVPRDRRRRRDGQRGDEVPPRQRRRRGRAAPPWSASTARKSGSAAVTAACIASNVGAADAVGEQRRVERRRPSAAAG